MVLVKDLASGQTGYVRGIDFLRESEEQIHVNGKVRVVAIPPAHSSYRWYFVQRSYELEKSKRFMLFANILPDVSSIHPQNKSSNSIEVRVFDTLHPNEQREITYMNFRSQIILLEKAIYRAVRREDFLKAARLKTLRDSTQEDLTELCYSDAYVIS